MEGAIIFVWLVSVAGSVFWLVISVLTWRHAANTRQQVEVLECKLTEIARATTSIKQKLDEAKRTRVEPRTPSQATPQPTDHRGRIVVDEV